MHINRTLGIAEVDGDGMRQVQAVRGSRLFARTLLEGGESKTASRDLLEWLTEVATVSEAQWNAAKHPRGAFAQNRGWFSPTDGSRNTRAAGREVGRTSGHVIPSNGTRSRVIAIADKRQRQGAKTSAQPPAPSNNPYGPTINVDKDIFWKGTLLSAKGMNLPTFLIDWAQNERLAVEYGQVTQYKVTLNKLYLSDLIQVRRNQRIGAAGVFQGPADKGDLSSIYNEVFHAWFDQYVENAALSSAWLLRAMREQTQFGDDVGHKSEEAMSELAQQIISAMQDGKSPPPYDEILKIGRQSAWYVALTPQHNEDKQIWANDPGAGKVMSEKLYYATVWILFNGASNPLPHRAPGTPGAASPLIAGLDDGDVLGELRKFFISKFPNRGTRPKKSPRKP